MMTTIKTPPAFELHTVKAEPRVDSRVMAGWLGVKARASFALIERYSDTFKGFGQLTFKKAVGERHQGGGNAERYAMLNEDQAYFLLSLSRNNERVVALKAKLVKAFSEARRAAGQHQTEYLPTYHQLHEELHALAVGSENERFVHMNVNKLINQIVGLDAGQRGAMPTPKQSMLIVAQSVAATAARGAPNHREGYQRIKSAMLALSAVTMGSLPA